MNLLVLDTNIVSYLMKGDPLAEKYRPHLEGNTPAISFMTVAELYEGAFRARWGSSRLAHLHGEIQSYLVIPSSPEICECWGQIRAERRNQPISAQDAWIAATALTLGCTLATHDAAGFAGITGLQVLTEWRG